MRLPCKGIDIAWPFRAIIYLTVIALFSGIFIFLSADEKDTGSVKIGVLLDLSGPMYLEPELVLDWAAEKVNTAGGINGRMVELVYRDTAEEDLLEAAETFLEDDAFQVVIGPLSSDDAFQLAPKFIQRKKLLISPTATSADLYRAFAGEKFFWRTISGDMNQAKTILSILDQRGVRKLALVYQDSPYGKTFMDWIPFLAYDTELEITANVCLGQASADDYGPVLDKLLESDPECIIAAAYADEVVLLQREMETRQTGVEFFLTDAGQTSYLLEELQDSAEGIEGVAPSFDIDSGFREQFEAKYGSSPLSFHASIWDSFLLAAYTLARNEYKEGNEWIEDSLKTILSGRGTEVRWDAIEQGLTLLGDGNYPDIQGAASSLEYDLHEGVEPVQAFYAHWQVQDGGFSTIRTVNTGEIELVSTTDFLQDAIDPLKSIFLLNTDSGVSVSGTQTGLKAIIISTTSQWQNYRHQSDALSVYNVLIDNGMSDDDIILMDVDDVPTADANPLPGVVRHVTGGPDVRTGAVVDYSGVEVTSENLRNILLGNKTAQTPTVLESSTGTNLLLFIVGHGNSETIPFDYGDHLSSGAFQDIVDDMYESGQFRKMLVVTELCFGASIASGLDTPNVLYLTAAADMEQSFAANYDPEIEAWLADEFSYKLVTAVRRKPRLYITDLYSWLYDRVSGSHVQLLNYENYADFRTARISDFFIP